MDNNTFQDHHRSQVHSLQDHFLLLQDHCASLQDHSSVPNHTENYTFQDHFSVKDVQGIISLKKSFPHSFDTTGSMPGVYTIRLDPSVPPVQHARRKVPIECREAIEKLLQDMVDQAIIAPVTEPMEWVSSLTYPHKTDGSLCICLDPHDLNKAIIQEHYKAPTLDEMSGAKVFSKLDVKDEFWSIHLDTPSSFLTTFNTHKGLLLVPPHAIWVKNVPGCLSNADGPNH